MTKELLTKTPTSAPQRGDAGHPPGGHGGGDPIYNDHLSQKVSAPATQQIAQASPVRRTVRSACHGICNRCQEDRCQFPVYCYADPVELALGMFGAGEIEEDSQLGAALRRALTALAEGALEHAEAAIERAFEHKNN